MLARRAVRATVLDIRPRGAQVEVFGLHALLPREWNLAPGQELDARITRMDPDEGRIFVSRSRHASGQLPLPVG